MNAVLNKIAKGITVCYSEVFPEEDNDYFHSAYMGKLFLVADSYCLNPDCTCKEAVLYFVQVYPRENKEVLDFMVGLKLNGRLCKIHDYGKFTKREIQAIVMHFTSDPTILGLLKERREKTREKAKEMLG